MGLGRFLLSMFNTGVLVEETISVQEKVYREAKREMPDADPHVLLARVYASRLQARGVASGMVAMQAGMEATTLVACVPEPQCIRALALMIIHEERPDLFGKHPELRRELDSLMKPVLDAAKNGTLKELYARRNPKMGKLHDNIP